MDPITETLSDAESLGKRGKKHKTGQNTERCTQVLWTSRPLEQTALFRMRRRLIRKLKNVPERFTPAVPLRLMELKPLAEGILEEEARKAKEELEERRKRVAEEARDKGLSDPDSPLLNKKKKKRKKSKEEKEAMKVVTWQEQVNATRQAILSAIKTIPFKSNKAIAKYVGCDVATVNRVVSELFFRQETKKYVYQPGVPKEEEEAFLKEASDEKNVYLCINDYKRQFPDRSRKWIAARLKEIGKKYRRIKSPAKELKDKAYLHEVMWTSLTALQSNSILWFDECVFPVSSAPDKAWLEKDQLPKQRSGTVDGYKALVLYAICDQNGVLAIQIYYDPPDATCFSYFIENFLHQYNRDSPFVILLDNAPTHHVHVYGELWRNILLFNERYQFKVNLIEHCFAKAKFEWQRRPFARGIFQEAEFLASMFIQKDMSKDFSGYRRQYLRDILSYFKD